MDGSEQRRSIWQRAERGTRGPEPGLDRGALAVAAVDLADSGGLGAVSMRAVAGCLGTSAGALYRYVDQRSDLLDLMADQVVAELRPYPSPGPDWLQPMIGMAGRQRLLNQRHPWLIELGYRSSGIGPEGLTYFDACLGILASCAASTRAKFEVIALLTGLAGLFARESAQQRSSHNPFSADSLAAYPHLSAAVPQLTVSAGTDDLFDRTARALLIGLLGEPAGRSPHSA